MPDLLIELFSEELPARMQGKARDDLKRMVTDGLVNAGLTYASAGAFSTPRRLTLTVEGLTAQSAPVREDRKGPRTDAPQAAIDGFLRSTGLTLDQLEIRDDKKAQVYFAVVQKPGRAASAIIADVLETTIRTFPWPKSMRWGTGTLRWVRPLQSILCILTDETGAEVVPVTVDHFTAGNTTEGHRFMAPGRFGVSSFDDYRTKLLRAKVMLDSAEREAHIWNAATNAAFAVGGTVVADAGLLAEVAGLVEWPVVLMGTIGADFLTLPPEVLQTSMREHQKFFSVKNAAGQIDRFITVANIEAPDHGATILAGNQKVLSARLSDARFFWENDLRVAKSGMGEWADGLKSVTFHNKLGSQSDRITRIAALAREIAPLVGADADDAEQAARLAKLDLRSAMVGEFPELQGVMGRYYIAEWLNSTTPRRPSRGLSDGADPADRGPGSGPGRMDAIAALPNDTTPRPPSRGLSDGADPADRGPGSGPGRVDSIAALPNDTPPRPPRRGLSDSADPADRGPGSSPGREASIANAAHAHWQPLGPSDDVPSDPISVAVALADKIDTLTGFWAIDEKPTGSKDPFALRRAALGVIRLVVGNGVRVSDPLGHMIPLLFTSYYAHLRQKAHALRLCCISAEHGNAYEPEFMSATGEWYQSDPDTEEEKYKFDSWIFEPNDEVRHCEVSPSEEGYRLNFMYVDGRQFGFQRILDTSYTLGTPWKIVLDLLAFLHDRLKVYLKDQSIRHDIIDACLAMPGNDDLTLLVNRARALNATLLTPDGANLIAGFKRANNILSQAEQKDGVEYSFGADPKFAETDEERALFTALDAADAIITPAMAAEDFTTAMSAMATLRAPIDAFFTAVQVNSDNPIIRRNRLNLLHRIRSLCGQVADLTKVEG